VPIIILLAGLAMWYTPKVLGKGAVAVLKKSPTTNQVASLEKLSPKLPNPVIEKSAGTGQNPVPAVQGQAIEKSAGTGQALPPLYLTGVMMSPRKGKISVTLSDGRVLHQDDKALSYVCKDYVIVDGRRVEYCPMQSTATVQPLLRPKSETVLIADKLPAGSYERRLRVPPVQY